MWDNPNINISTIFFTFLWNSNVWVFQDMARANQIAQEWKFMPYSREAFNLHNSKSVEALEGGNCSQKLLGLNGNREGGHNPMYKTNKIRKNHIWDFQGQSKCF